MHHREIYYDERDYEDGATPGQEIVTFGDLDDDLDDGRGDAPFDYEAAQREEVMRQKYK
jgi:hypothetical protein